MGRDTIQTENSAMSVVCTNTMISSYVDGILQMGDLEVDVDRLLCDPNYQTQLDLDPVMFYVLRALPFMDHGWYMIYTDVGTGVTHNLMTGESTDTRDFGVLFSFGGCIRKLFDPVPQTLVFPKNKS